jgi:hypothetical protein
VKASSFTLGVPISFAMIDKPCDNCGEFYAVHDMFPYRGAYMDLCENCKRMAAEGEAKGRKVCPIGPRDAHECDCGATWK